MDKLCSWKQHTVHPGYPGSSEVEPTELRNHVDIFSAQNHSNMTQQCEDVKSVSVRSDAIHSDPSNTPEQVTCHSSSGDDHIYRLDSESNQNVISQRIQDIVRRFSERALRVRRRFDFPPTPSTISSCEHGVKMLNKIPDHLKAGGPVLMKRKLQRWLLDKAFYTLNEFFTWGDPT
ncbi:hypothetical protein J6590_092286 [Homalodisca vitripennis]|nr:hypothetical protein J6590_023554 [Homalodisca vitripennis]KAG8334355.1 hypothetical protein J6590_092286 [Homalodisca vitripennis]